MSSENPQEPQEMTIDQIQARLGQILREHGNMESNIPVVPGHEYWQLKKELSLKRNK